MANRTFREPWSLDIGAVDVYASITVGASGAVASWTGLGKGVASVTKETADGQYTIALEDSYVGGLLACSVTLVHSTGSDPTSAAVQARVNADNSATSTPSVVLQGYDFTDGTAANFASGAKLLVRLTLKNSTV